MNNFFPPGTKSSTLRFYELINTVFFTAGNHQLVDKGYLSNGCLWLSVTLKALTIQTTWWRLVSIFQTIWRASTIWMILKNKDITMAFIWVFVILVWTRLNFYVHRNRDKITMGQISIYMGQIIMAMNYLVWPSVQTMHEGPSRPVSSCGTNCSLSSDDCNCCETSRFIKHDNQRQKSWITKCINIHNIMTMYPNTPSINTQYWWVKRWY